MLGASFGWYDDKIKISETFEAVKNFTFVDLFSFGKLLTVSWALIKIVI